MFTRGYSIRGMWILPAGFISVRLWDQDGRRRASSVATMGCTASCVAKVPWTPTCHGHGVGSIFTVENGPWMSMVHGLNTWSRWCVMAMNMEKHVINVIFGPYLWIFVVGGFQKYLPLCGSHPWGRQNEEIQHDSALYSSTKSPGVGALLGESGFSSEILYSLASCTVHGEPAMNMSMWKAFISCECMKGHVLRLRRFTLRRMSCRTWGATITHLPCMLGALFFGRGARCYRGHFWQSHSTSHCYVLFWVSI